MNRFGFILLAILITAIGATVTSLVWTGTASADGNGELTFVEFHKDGVDGVDGLSLAVSVTMSPDGKHLYAAGSSDNAVAVFSRNSTSGALTFVEVVRDGVNGVGATKGAFSVAVSPDGKHLYTASQGANAVAVFSRNSTSGKLTFLQVVKDGQGGVDGLDSVKSVTASPDGKYVYTAGSSDRAVAVFSRNSTSGELSFVQVVKDGEGGVDGLNGAFSVTVSPDGKHLYAASQFDDAVAVFSRNLTTGTLTFVEVHKDGLDGVDGLNSSRSVTATPDGRQIYVVGIDGNAVAVFSRNSTTGKLTFVEVVKDGEGGVDGLRSRPKTTPHFE
jgi:6-phosphogluconolactonase (cycloisomerase 2 family)